MLEQPTSRSRKSKNTRVLGHLWAFFFPVYFLAAVALDPNEVTNREYLQFVLATGNPPPEYWVHGRYLAGTDNDPVVLVRSEERRVGKGGGLWVASWVCSIREQ